ncbi:hypothetical protein RYH80_07755 [Halobaculum sp. MBLA0147]|uniref:hypothetical protein n=1 Tax=Halobaculum sp. MBLA0147 TaxID=3079934 RepID=UPI0035258221
MTRRSHTTDADASAEADGGVVATRGARRGPIRRLRRVATATWYGLVDLRRTPTLLALLVVAPAYVVGLFGVVAPTGPARLHLGGDTVQTTLETAFPAFTTPMTAALVAGVAGLFVVRSAAAADARLVAAGYTATEVVAARLGPLGLLAVCAAVVPVAVSLATVEPVSLPVFLLGTVLAALTYAAVGVLVGATVGRLAGVYVVLFGTMIDLFVFQNPLATDPPALAALLPGHAPLAIALAGCFDRPVAVETALHAAATCLLATTAALLALVREADTR